MTETPDRSTAAVREQQAHDDHPAPALYRVRPLELWLGILGAPVAWTVHTIVETAINSHACISARGTPPPTGTQLGTATWILLLAISLVLLLAGVAALLTSIRNWKRAQGDSADEKHDVLEVGEGRIRFMTMAGILLGGIFSLLLLVNTISLFLAPQCSP